MNYTVRFDWLKASSHVADLLKAETQVIWFVILKVELHSTIWLTKGRFTRNIQADLLKAETPVICFVILKAELHSAIWLTKGKFTRNIPGDPLKAQTQVIRFVIPTDRWNTHDTIWPTKGSITRGTTVPLLIAEMHMIRSDPLKEVSHVIHQVTYWSMKYTWYNLTH